MLEDDIEINKLEEENQILMNEIKELDQSNKLLEEELNYSRCNNNRSNIHTNGICNNLTHLHNLDIATEYDDLRLPTEEELDDLANAYAEAMNINTSEEVK